MHTHWNPGSIARAVVLGICVIPLASACAPLNVEKSYDYKQGYRFGNLEKGKNSDELFVVLAFSGGGTRAASFSYGVLNALNETPLPGSQGKRSLLDEVDVISSVSGGSFTSAYYGLHGKKIFGEEYKEKFLYKNIHSALIWRVACPWNWPFLMSPYYSRSDLAAEYYADHIFGDATFGDLEEGNRPFLIINAADLSLGTRFEFTQRQFDLLGSDVAPIKVARAVAASSAFPGILAPLAMENHARSGYTEPTWVSMAISEDFAFSPRRYLVAESIRSYMDKKNRPYVHLVDGGVVDNIGLRGLHFSLQHRDEMTSDGGRPVDDSVELNLMRMIGDDKIKKLVVIVVDAKTALSTKLDKSRASPSIQKVLLRVATDPVDKRSFETIQVFFEELLKHGEVVVEVPDDTEGVDGEGIEVEEETAAEGEATDFKSYLVHIQFDAIENRKLRKKLRRVDTNFHLSESKVDKLIQAGERLLKDSNVLAELLADLQAQAEGE